MIEADITIAEDTQQLEQVSNLNTSVVKNLKTLLRSWGLVYTVHQGYSTGGTGPEPANLPLDNN